uniref:ADP-ribosylation factor-like protein 2 n=1 Tax=Balaenoptera musculus TaxID=9771 RepID=A0A8C0CVX4_BALMU
MGLLTILKKMKQKERELRLLMLGLDNAGKTTILKKFNGEDIDTISPTLGFNIKTLEHRGFKLNIWDVGGQKSLRSYWRNYFESTDGLIWVVDSADRQRMQDCQRELQNLLVEERLAGATLLIFANKQDLPGALSSNAIREALDLLFNCGSTEEASSSPGRGPLTEAELALFDPFSKEGLGKGKKGLEGKGKSGVTMADEPATGKRASRYSALPQPSPLGYPVPRCLGRSLSRLLKGSSHKTFPWPTDKLLNPCPHQAWKCTSLRCCLLPLPHFVGTSSQPFTIGILQARSRRSSLSLSTYTRLLSSSTRASQELFRLLLH